MPFTELSRSLRIEFQKDGQIIVHEPVYVFFNITEEVNWPDIFAILYDHLKPAGIADQAECVELFNDIARIIAKYVALPETFAQLERSLTHWYVEKLQLWYDIAILLDHSGIYPKTLIQLSPAERNALIASWYSDNNGPTYSQSTIREKIARQLAVFCVN